MNKLLAIFVPAIALFFASCGDDALFNENLQPTVSQQIYVVPDRFVGEPYTFGFQTAPIYLEVDQVVKFWATYIVNDSYLNTDYYDDYISEKIWDINGEYFNLNFFRYSFSEPGHKVVTLRSVDYLKDTITEHLDVYVNTPISAKLVYPEDGFNLVDPDSKDGIDLVWNISGVDDWETSSCDLYASYSKENFWERGAFAKGSCDDEIHINGPLFDDLPEDSSATVYWAVIASNRAQGTFFEKDTSPIYHFSTKFRNSDSAKLILPITHENLWSSDSLETEIFLVSAGGDTIATYYSYTIDSTIVMKVLPQSGLRIYANEKSKPEYSAKPISVDIMAATRYYIDTLTFMDTVPPFVTPATTEFDSTEQITFFALDQGSGVNGRHVTVTVSDDTLSSSYLEQKITFSCPKFFNVIYVSVSAQDNARNTSAKVYWKLQKNGATVRIDGPYSKSGGN